MTVLAAEEIRRFGITPKVALLSHSSFGAADTPTALKMRKALAISCRPPRRTSKSTARCTATPRSPRRCAASSFPIRG